MLRFFLLFPVLLLVSCAKPGKISLAMPAAPAPFIEHAPEADRDIDRDEDSYQEAARFYRQKRIGTSDAELPIEKLFAAKRHADLMPRYSLARRRFVTGSGSRGVSPESTFGPGQANSWQPLGPGNVGGRTRSLLVHPNDPNTMWAGSVGGGVWKTTDGGGSWSPVSDLLPSIGIGAMALDPNNPDVLYAGTGEWYTGTTRGDSIRGAGIFKSTNGGLNWTQLPATATSSFYYVNKMVVSPNNGSHIYAATWNGIWYSANGGISWRIVLGRGNPDYGCQDLVIRTDQSTDFLFAACGTVASPQTVVFRNMDAAGSGEWTQVFQQPNMGRTSLALAPSNQSIVYAVSAYVVSATDTDATKNAMLGGSLLGVYASQSNGDPDTWEARVTYQDPNRLNTVLFTNPREAFADVCSGGKATYSNQGGYDNVIAVDPADPNVVWVGGIDLFRSDDGGRNWGIAAYWQAGPPQLSHADNHVLLFAPGYDGGGNQTLFAASDGGIYKTVNARAATATGERAACSPYPTSIQWTNLNHNYAVTQFYHGSVFPGGAAYMAGAQDNGTTRGSDATGANSWVSVFSGDGGFSSVDPTDPNVIYVSAQGLTFARSANGGGGFITSIKGITEPSANFLFITPHTMDPSNSKRIYLGGRTLWRTEDGALNWSAVSAPVAPAGGQISAIAVSPSDPDHVAFGTNAGQVFYSQAALSGTATTAWTFSQPRAGYLSRLVFSPADPLTIYATYSQYKFSPDQNHVYQSRDGGATWQGIDGAGSTGIPDIPVFTIVVDPQNTQALYLGTDIGVFVSLDQGATWARDDNPFADSVTETLTLDRTSGQSNLVAFTHGRGVWRLALPGSGAGCAYGVSTHAIATPAFGGAFPVSITTDGACSWSALPGSNFALLASPAGGKGSGQVTVNVTSNSATSGRDSVIVIQNQAVKVTQDGAVGVSGNDEFAGAFAISPLPWVGVQDTSSATENETDPVHTCTGSKDFKSLWFSYKAEQSGTLRLGFKVARKDQFGDAGSVLTAYSVDAGGPGSQLACSVTPLADTVLTTRFPQIPVAAGTTYLIEVSATVFGQPAGAQAMGGSLTLTAQFLP